MGQAFRSKLDIINTALQHCELPRIGDLSEMSPSAQEMGFRYDKIRRRELRRNLWRFATRRVALRPIASTTVLFVPSPYSSLVTYPGGAIVQDSFGDPWISLIDNNLGNPLQAPQWDAYFGPLTVTPWNVPAVPTTNPASNPYTPPSPGVPYGNQSGISYFPGELVYLQDGKGGMTIYRSIGTTGDGPILLDQWKPNVTYTKGQIAFLYSDPSGQLITGLSPLTGSIPDTGPVTGPTGGLTGDNVQLTGDGLLITEGTSGFTGLTGDNVQLSGDGLLIGEPTPGGGGSGGGGSDGGGSDEGSMTGPGLSTNAFQSTIDFNTGNQPDICEPGAALQWLSDHAYNTGELAEGSDTQLYQAVSPSTGVDPTTDTLYVNWTPLNMFVGTWTQDISPVPRAISNQWQMDSGSSVSVVISYPLTAGPLEDQTTKNAYRMPAGYLREAPQDPKRGGQRVGWLGAPNVVSFTDDWELEGNYIVSLNHQTILYRFVADVTDVASFDDMFCEGIAAELALACISTLQPGRADLVRSITAAYNRVIFEARTSNGIEIGPVEPPADDYITVRL